MRRFATGAALCAALAGVSGGRAFAQSDSMVRARITRPIREDALSTLPGNVHPLARGEFDRGAAPPDLPMGSMLLVLARSTQQESALQNLLASQQDPSSPLYHRWLTPQEFGQRFGAADQDVQTVTAWLASHGFQVEHVANGRNLIEFSGTAAQVQDAFHTQIHKYVINGKTHWANATDPEIPSALAGVVRGVASLYNFRKKPQIIRAAGSFAGPQFTSSTGSHALAPADYATIYNINPLYSAGINGTGTVIAVVGRSNINVQDVASFRSTFNLSANSPQIIVNGSDPGNLGGDEEAEAVLDASWSGAIAPGATIKLVVSKSTNASDGVDLSEAYIIDNNLGDVMTESFGSCEASYTAAEGAAASSLAAQAAAQGITYAVAAGDSGAMGCDDPNSAMATGPLSVNVLASTSYTVAVGGTQFNENGNDAAYWQSSNASNSGSARSYIPEDVWNESCTTGHCTAGNSPGLWAGGGGASIIFSKPSWQAGVPGIPNDGARDVPDISLTAAGHDAYLLCLDGSCTPNSTGRISFDGYSGTSAATPSFAGIMALIVQKTGSRQGQANYVLYGLAATESLSACDASNTATLPSSGCVFNDVTSGNNAVPGESGYGTGGAKYQAGVGYDLATGLGSLNVANLASNWNSIPNPTSAFQLGFDQPGPQQSTFIGLATFSGWAINSYALISQVQILIDGSPYANAAYGLSRPDVCSRYPGRKGCPNVGWSIAIDTTALSDGPHVFQVTATSATGTHWTTSTAFTVANWTTDDPMLVAIDRPGQNSAAFSGVAGFGGWALDKTGLITSVSMAIDGVPYGGVQYGGSRLDVCAVYGGLPNCPDVGWNAGVDTSLLPDGTHTLAVTGITATGQNTTVVTSFKTANLSGGPMMISIDTPNGQTPPISGTVNVGGWAIDSNANIQSVTVSVDGSFAGNASYGGARADVCTVFPNRPGCPYVGWNFSLNASALANGQHTIQVTATAVDGPRATASSSFTVANATSAGMRMSIDQPGAQNSTVLGVTPVFGWALDENDPITTIAVSIDGVSRGSAMYGGSRPDVCVVFPSRAGCPNVGWVFWLDTTLIPDGPHTLSVTATSAAGDQLTQTAPFTVANWTAANPMKIAIDNPNSASSAFAGTVVFGGWAISDIAGIQGISIAVDNTPLGSAAYGGSRADVCALYSGKAGCPNVGWSFAIDTTALANGNHTLAVTALSTGGQRSTATSTFNVSNSGPIVISIDRPGSSDGPFSGFARFGGWAVDTAASPISAVNIFVDGAAFGNAAYGASRPDVCAIYTTAAGCPDVGWNYLLDTTLLANGPHVLQVTAVSFLGTQSTVAASFTVTQ